MQSIQPLLGKSRKWMMESLRQSATETSSAWALKEACMWPRKLSKGKVLSQWSLTRIRNNALISISMESLIRCRASSPYASARARPFPTVVSMC